MENPISNIKQLSFIDNDEKRVNIETMISDEVDEVIKELFD